MFDFDTGDQSQQPLPVGRDEAPSAAQGARGADTDLGADECDVTITIRDPDCLAALNELAPGRAREVFLETALRIGMLAVGQAQTRIDSERLRDEGARVIEGLTGALEAHHKAMTGDVARTLNEYFDPRSGRMMQRIEDMMKDGGELERAIRQHIDGEESALARTLARHVGRDSPLMTTLDPESQSGVTATISEMVATTSKTQRDRVLAEFSLDNPESALSRTVRELTAAHGEAGTLLEKKITEVVREFSLDNKDGALTRLVGRVEATQRALSDEFSLDRDGSALARMRKELLEQIDGIAKSQAAFQVDLSARLAEMAARKVEKLKSTRHGDEFEMALFERIQERAQSRQDVATAVGTGTGKIRNCKKGDITLELGPEHAAAGAVIVIEAKQDAAFTLARARAEIEEARANRGAEIGIFVFSARTAPEGLDRLQRLGDDIFVVWDSEDADTDVMLEVALSLATALATGRAQHGAAFVGLDDMERAILAIEKQITQLDEFKKGAETITSAAERITERHRKMRTALKKELSVLNDCLEGLKSAA